MNITEKAGYLKGLAEGLDISADSKEGKLLLALVDAFAELAKDVDGLDADYEELHAYVEELDEDLGELEQTVYGEDECDCDCDCDCDDEDYDDEEYSVICPTCKESIFLTEEDLDNGELECPFCNEKIEIGFEDCDCDCDCGCDCDCE